MTQQEWRTSKFLWLLFGPVIGFAGVMTVLCVVSPLFPGARQQPLVCAVNFFGGVPLFGWMTWSLWRIARINRVRADENGVFISNEGKEARIEWGEIKALWTPVHSSEGPLHVWARGRDFVLPPGLERPTELRALLEQRTGLEFKRFVFGPPEEDRVILLSGALLCRKWWIANGMLLLLVGIILGPLALFFSWRSWLDQSAKLVVSVGGLVLISLLLYLCARAMFDFCRLRAYKNATWTFDARAIRRTQGGQITVLLLENIERLERVGRFQLRATGAKNSVQWPKESYLLSHEEEFLAQHLGISWLPVAR